MSKYLETFPEQYQQFVHNRFSQAYVFASQSCVFGEDDVIDIAVGPRAMKSRVVCSCEELRPLVDEERQQVLDQIIATIDESDDFLKEIRGEVDHAWAQARIYAAEHPRKEKKPLPVTEAQKNYLKKLGCNVVPQSKKEATKLIDKYKKYENNSNAFTRGKERVSR